jgi:hypothetical protein
MDARRRDLVTWAVDGEVSYDGIDASHDVRLAKARDQDALARPK